MPHQFNSFTGRIVESTHPQPFYPISAARLERSEPPKIMFDSVKTKPVSVPSPTARYATSAFENVAKKQKIFLAPNSIPVFLKGGAFDRGLFGLTVTLSLVGFGLAGQAFYDLAKK